MHTASRLAIRTLCLAAATSLVGCGSSKLTASTGGPAEAGVCVGTPGALTSASLPRQTFGWTFVPAFAGADAGTSRDAGAVPVARDSGAAASRCATVSDGVTDFGDPLMTSTCVGEAWLRQTAAGPTLVFDDGSAFTWDGSLPATAAPYVASSSGDPVWADFEENTRSDCPECALYKTNTLEIRTSAGGIVRFYAQQGSTLPGMTDGQILDIFGVPATAMLDCTFQVRDSDCISFQRTEYGHQLATTPPQTVASGVWSTVDAPTGHYVALWYSSSETAAKVTCTDEPGEGTDNGFVAALVAP
jgi:hypothetical protein